MTGKVTADEHNKTLKLNGKSAKTVSGGAERMTVPQDNAISPEDEYDKLITILSGVFDPGNPELGRLLNFGDIGGIRKKGDKPERGRARGNESEGAFPESVVPQSKRTMLNEATEGREKEGEPIDMVTGSYLIEQCDFIINDITGIYAVERCYESLLAAVGSPIGKGWTLSLFSNVVIYDDRVEVILPDNHTETFLKTAEGLRNRRGGTKRLTLEENDDGFLLKEARTGIRRFYGADGRQLSVADKNGNRTIYCYDGEFLHSIKFASGQYLLFTWSGNKITSMQDCIGRKVMYRYTGEFLTEVEMANGGVERYTYDTKGCITDVTNANGVTFVHNEYDYLGRVIRQKLSNGQEYLLSYADDDRTNTFLIPAFQKKVLYTYNKNRQLIRIGYQDGSTEEKGYDCWENCIWKTDRAGRRTEMSYDGYGHLLEIRQPGGLVMSCEYDTVGNRSRMWDNTGYMVWYTYDKNGNLVEQREQIDASAQRKISYEYDKYGRLTAVINPNGNRETYEYDRKFWRNTAFTSAMGSRYEYELDGAGRCVARIDDDGRSDYAYNHFDILCMERNPLGDTTRYIYNRTLDLTGIVRPNHYAPLSNDEKRKIYIYDSFHRRMLSMDETGAVSAVLRDGEGNIVKEIHPNEYDMKREKGAGKEYAFDGDGYNYQIRYPDGGIERKWYDAAGNLVRLCGSAEYDAAGGTGYCYAYDNMNRLVQVTAPDGTVQKRLVYDLCGNVIKVIDTKGMRVGQTDADRVGEIYSYNYIGWLTEYRKPLRVENGKVEYQLIQYRYDKAGNRIQERQFLEYQTESSSSGIVHVISYAYDADNRLILVTDCTGAVCEYQYDSHNRCISERQKINDRVSRMVRRVYDAAGRMTKLIRTADQEGCGRRNVSVGYEYDKNGNNTRVSFPSGAEILREYDPADRLIYERHVDRKGGIDNTVLFSYDKAGNLICVTDNRGRKSKIEYDLMNRMVRQIGKDKSVTQYFYNKNGQLISRIQPNEYAVAGVHGAGERYTYDDSGRVLTVLHADGSIREKNVYNMDGQLICRVDSGVTTRFQYDFGGRCIQAETEGRTAQQYEYDVRGNITDIVDGEGNRTQYILDKWGRITQIRRPDGYSEFYAYDYAGNIIRSTDGEGNTSVYEYNEINKISLYTDPVGNTESYAYDGHGRLCKRVDRNGVVTKYTYNMYGGLLERRAKRADGTDSAGLCDRFEYTEEGLLKSAASLGNFNGESLGIEYCYVYDEMDRVRKKMSGGRTLLELSYDWNGNLIRQKDATGKMIEYRYNLLDQVTDIWDDGMKIAEYVYNPEGKVGSLRCGNLFTEYSYDVDQNLIGLKTTLGNELLTQNQYCYDKNGNCIEKLQKNGRISYDYDSVGRLRMAEYPEYSERLFYDGAGNRVKRVREVTADADVPLLLEERYYYDKRNCLMQLEKEDAVFQFEYDNAGNLEKDNIAVYEYDEFNRNIRIKTFDGSILTNRYDPEGLRYEMEENGSRVSFLYLGNEVVAEKREDKNVRYIRTDALLVADGEPDGPYYCALDEIGSITHMADGRGVVNCYVYDAWGNVTVSQERVKNRFRFQGHQFDTVSGQYYLRARYYNPVIGRFTQEDTYYEDGLNLYAYCKNNPVRYTDPDGNKACPTGKKRTEDAINDSTANVSGRSLSKKAKIKEYEIMPYGEFLYRSEKGDGLSGHELLQNAWLIANGHVIKRGDEKSRKNPAVALRQEPVHKFISALQIHHKLTRKNLAGVSWNENVRVNMEIMKAGGVPVSVINQLTKYTIKFAMDEQF